MGIAGLLSNGAIISLFKREVNVLQYCKKLIMEQLAFFTELKNTYHVVNTETGIGEMAEITIKTSNHTVLQYCTGVNRELCTVAYHISIYVSMFTS